MLVSLLIPLLLTGLGWIGWKVLQSKMITCQVCGANLVSNTLSCPVCGATISNDLGQDSSNSAPASSATIDVKAEDVDLNE